jgi:hypothetical protein
MSESTLEIELLDVDLDASVPCEYWVGWYIACGKESVARVRATCRSCTAPPAQCFLCAYHLDLLKKGKAPCSNCGKKKVEWRET